MKRKRHNPEQIIRKLRSAEQLLNQGQTVADVCRSLEVSAATYHGDFQERCHSLAAFQAAWISGSAWLDWSPSGGLLIHTTTGLRQQRVD
jgi:hypothetical protein